MTAHSVHNLTLYCDNLQAENVHPNGQDYETGMYQGAKPGEHYWGEFPHEFYHASEKICQQRAKRAGWRFFRDGRLLCPRCNAARIKLTRQSAANCDQ